MSSLSPSPFPYQPKIWFFSLLSTAIFSTVVGAGLTVFKLTPGDAFENFLHSYCIGFLICLGILGPRSWLGRRHRPRPMMMAALAVLGMLFGLFAGRALAAWISGHSLRWAVLFEVGTLVTSMVISVFATFAATVYFWTREREAVFNLQTSQARERAEIVSRQLTETQLRLLRAQIEPHMLFNTLSNLRTLIAQNPQAAQTMLDRLIDFFRASLQASRSEWSSCQREFDLAHDYLALISIRLGPRLSYELALPAELASVEMPSMLVQPLVENAIKHGIEPAMDGGQVRVSLRQVGAELELRIDNSGVALDDARLSDDGYGLQHLRERLASLYGERARFELGKSATGDTLARVILPIEKKPANDPGV